MHTVGQLIKRATVFTERWSSRARQSFSFWHLLLLLYILLGKSTVLCCICSCICLFVFFNKIALGKKNVHDRVVTSVNSQDAFAFNIKIYTYIK